MLFKVTSCLLIVLAWAWVTLEWVPDNSVGAYYSLTGEYLGNWPSLSNDEPDIYVPPNPIVKVANEYRHYVFTFGVLAAVWCYLLVGKMAPHLNSGYVAEVWHKNQWRINNAAGREQQ